MNTLPSLALRPARLLVLILLAAGLLACSRPSVPVTGSYRAVLNLKGGELPLQLQIDPGKDPTHGAVTLAVQIGDTRHEASDVAINNGELSANVTGVGSLHLRFDRDSLQGDLRLSGGKDPAVTLPVQARLNQNWRFFATGSTDNADLSGVWQLEAISSDHFNVPVVMQLQQTFDQVQGMVTLPAGQSLPVLGQVKGDEVWLATVGDGRAVLLKGAMDTHGELRGEFWVNTGTAHPWVARKTASQASTNEDGLLRHVGLPWAIPTQ